TTHSSGSISRRRHSVERPSSRTPSRWFGTSSRVRANQNPESPVRTRPLSRISVGRTTSKVEIRSLATSSRRSSSSSNRSRTFPLPTCVAASGMDGLLPPFESGEPLEDGVSVAGVPGQVEQRVEVDPARDRVVAPDELAEIAFLLLRAEGIFLDEPVGGIAPEPRLDEREQHALAGEEPVARLEVVQHPLRPHLEALDEPHEPVEHVVERQERVGNDHALGGGMRDVALVPERDI